MGERNCIGDYYEAKEPACMKKTEGRNIVAKQTRG